MTRKITISYLGRELEEYKTFQIEGVEVFCHNDGITRNEFAVWRQEGGQMQFYYHCPNKQRAMAFIDSILGEKG